MFSRLASLFSRRASETVSARRIEFVTASRDVIANGYAAGGRYYWKG